MKLGATALLVLGWLATASAQAAPFTNGSFETGPNPGTFSTLPAGNSEIFGWIVLGSIDYVGTYWQPANGSRSVDLNGNSTGGISQIFDTVVGTVYRVTFSYAGNPDGSPITKTLRVQASGNAAQVFTFHTGSSSLAAMNWATGTYQFTATLNTTMLTFNSQTTGAFGPALDNVRVDPVPEPSAAVLAGLGLLAILLLRRRRSAVATVRQT